MKTSKRIINAALALALAGSSAVGTGLVTASTGIVASAAATFTNPNATTKNITSAYPESIKISGNSFKINFDGTKNQDSHGNRWGYAIATNNNINSIIASATSSGTENLTITIDRSVAKKGTLYLVKYINSGDGKQNILCPDWKSFSITDTTMENEALYVRTKDLSPNSLLNNISRIDSYGDIGVKTITLTNGGKNFSFPNHKIIYKNGYSDSRSYFNKITQVQRIGSKYVAGIHSTPTVSGIMSNDYRFVTLDAGEAVKSSIKVDKHVNGADKVSVYINNRKSTLDKVPGAMGNVGTAYRGNVSFTVGNRSYTQTLWYAETNASEWSANVNITAGSSKAQFTNGILDGTSNSTGKRISLVLI